MEAVFHQSGFFPKPCLPSPHGKPGRWETAPRAALAVVSWTACQIRLRFSSNTALGYRTTAGATVTSLADQDDDALMTLIKAGDRNAVGELYKRHAKRVFLFVRRFISDVNTAEDVTNDVFIEVWQKASNFEGRSKVSSWILGMARFKALSEIRKRRPDSASEEMMQTIEDDADTPEITAQKTDKSAVLKDCIAKLSQEHRQIIDLIYYHEKSVKEIAQILEIPENTVKTRAFHARKVLSHTMEKAGLDRGWP